MIRKTLQEVPLRGTTTNRTGYDSIGLLVRTPCLGCFRTICKMTGCFRLELIPGFKRRYTVWGNTTPLKCRLPPLASTLIHCLGQ